MEKITELKCTMLGGIASTKTMIPDYQGHLLINGTTKVDIRSRHQLKTWVTAFAKNLEFTGIKVHTHSIHLNGFRGLGATLIADNGTMNIRVQTDRNPFVLRFDILFLSMINIDQALLDCVEDFNLCSLDWLLLDRNDEISIVDEQERFSSLEI